mmetsp:Transcript_17948/g.53765  ORF Transcript_17948/g.53765 Transcript_17948/m.53765 type:complete len:288 (-) Transcript_17948:313-1176(-)
MMVPGSSHAQLSRCASRCCSTTHECSRRWSVVLTSALRPSKSARSSASPYSWEKISFRNARRRSSRRAMCSAAAALAMSSAEAAAATPLLPPPSSSERTCGAAASGANTSAAPSARTALPARPLPTSSMRLALPTAAPAAASAVAPAAAPATTPAAAPAAGSASDTVIGSARDMVVGSVRDAVVGSARDIVVGLARAMASWNRSTSWSTVPRHPSNSLTSFSRLAISRSHCCLWSCTDCSRAPSSRSAVCASSWPLICPSPPRRPLPPPRASTSRLRRSNSGWPCDS